MNNTTEGTKMTRFQVGQVVRSTVTAQGMTKGADYDVMQVDVRPSFLGATVEYQLQARDGSAAFWVGNGHLLLTEAAPPVVVAPAAPVLSANQMMFVRAARRAGLTVKDYSGRYMFGAKCPSVYLDSFQTFSTRAKTRTDSMGRGTVVYAQD